MSTVFVIAFVVDAEQVYLMVFRNDIGDDPCTAAFALPFAGDGQPDLVEPVPEGRAFGRMSFQLLLQYKVGPWPRTDGV